MTTFPERIACSVPGRRPVWHFGLAVWACGFTTSSGGKQKLNPIRLELKGKNVLLVDSGGSGKLDRKVFFLSEALPG